MEEKDSGVERLAKTIEAAFVNCTITKALSTYELAEILIFEHHHNRGDLAFIDAVQKSVSEMQAVRR